MTYPFWAAKRYFEVSRQMGSASVLPTRLPLQFLVKLAISGGLFWLMVARTNSTEVLEAVRDANAIMLIVAFSLHPVGFAISAIRWRTLLRARGSDCSLSFLVESYFVSVFFNNFLPSTVGGDVYRAYDSHRLGQTKTGALATVVVDRALGLLVLLLFATAALMMADSFDLAIPLLPLWILLAAGVLLSVIGMAFFPPAWLTHWVFRRSEEDCHPYAERVRRVIQSFMSFRNCGQTLFQAFCWSLLLQANVVLHHFLVAQAIGCPIQLRSFFLIVPLATLIMMLPVSVNGIGVRETVFVSFFAVYGVAQPVALAFSWIVYGMIVILGLIGGLVYVFRRGRPIKQSTRRVHRAACAIAE